jgi:UDP-N-acetyl-D-mannosaminuronic acid dehydrogenase
MADFENVVVVGLGYIGLPTAAVIASRGMQVIGVDVNERVVNTVASGSIHIAEPDLEGLVQKVVSYGSLKVATEPRAAEVFIIAVPTPIDEQKRADLKSVTSAVDSIAGVLRAGNLVILKSTVPIGTTEQMAKKIAHVRPDLTVGMFEGSEHAISVAYCPERVLPGRILSELVHNDRCIGGVTPNCARRAQRFYKSFVRGACIATSCVPRRWSS